MKSVRSRSTTRSISRRPRGSRRHSSTRSACLEKSAKLTPAPSQVAPSGKGRPRQTARGATKARAGASTAPGLCRNRADRLNEMAAVGAPGAVLLALHGVIGDPDRAAPVGDADLLHHVRAHDDEVEEREPHRALDGAGVDLLLDHRADLGYIGSGDGRCPDAGGKHREEPEKEASQLLAATRTLRSRSTCSSRRRSANTFCAYCAELSRSAPL